MDGSSGLAVFQKGKGTPALDGLQVLLLLTVMINPFIRVKLIIAGSL